MITRFKAVWLAERRRRMRATRMRAMWGAQALHFADVAPSAARAMVSVGDSARACAQASEQLADTLEGLAADE